MRTMEPKEVANGVVIKIRVKPRAKRFSIKLYDGQIVMEVKSPPMKGKANDDVVKELSSFFQKPVQLLKGHMSKHKTVLIQGIALSEIQSRLDRIASLS